MAGDEGCPYFVGEFVGAEGEPHALCPRTALKRMLERLADEGLKLVSGFEYEFFVFEETPHSIREKGYRNLKPLTPGNFGYSLLRTSARSELFAEFMDSCRALRLDLEGLHCETGPRRLGGCAGASAGRRSGGPGQSLQDLRQGVLPEARA